MPRARRYDPSTSHEAAASVNNVRESQLYILRLLRSRGPSTDEELWRCIPNNIISVSGARSRRSELVGLGLVKDSGIRRKTKANRQTIVWEVTPTGNRV
jgi:hypothetical protein